VDNIDTARKIGIGNAKMVTLDGDLAELSGSMTGGFRQQREGMGFSEKEVSTSISMCEKLQSDMGSKISNLEKKKTGRRRDDSQAAGAQGKSRGDIIKMEKSLHLDSGDIDVNKKVKQSSRTR